MPSRRATLGRPGPCPRSTSVAPPTGPSAGTSPAPVRQVERSAPPPGEPRRSTTMPWAKLLADLIVVLHATYFSFVVFGLLLILLGVVFRWGWVRNFWFRTLHLTAIGIVVLEALIGMNCPLTDWEDRLREMAG